MRISDWSSDVCSSDLPDRNALFDGDIDTLWCFRLRLQQSRCPHRQVAGLRHARRRVSMARNHAVGARAQPDRVAPVQDAEHGLQPVVAVGAAADHRSEEHTSELQSLMRSSYAVFCLKKKHTYTNNN